MHAIQPPKPPLEPKETRKVATRKKNTRRRLKNHPHRIMAIETTAKLFASTFICGLAVYGIVRLLPGIWSQQQRWQEISTEVEQAEGRVNYLRQDFERNFDSSQAYTQMKEQNNLLEPGQRQVFWQQSPKK